MNKPYDQASPDDLRSALIQAADGEEAWVRELLAEGADPSGIPLIMAIQCGELGIVQLFIAAGVDVNLHFATTTPLIRAVTSGYPAIVQVLIDAGADVNKPDDKGLPLAQVGDGSLSATEEDWDAIRHMLLARGAVATTTA